MSSAHIQWLRTTGPGYEVVDVDSVMDGELDGFINAFLSGMQIEK